MGQLEKPSRIRFVRREIARINTIDKHYRRKKMPKRVLNGTVCSASNTKTVVVKVERLVKASYL